VRRILFGAALLLLFLAPGAALADDVMVHVGHNRLDPMEVTIRVGDSVTFHNLDQMPGGHTIVAGDGSFQSPPLAKDQAWTHTFEQPGTYAYHIKEHPGANGLVVVE
jgi:plastocyanin